MHAKLDQYSKTQACMIDTGVGNEQWSRFYFGNHPLGGSTVNSFHCQSAPTSVVYCLCAGSQKVF